jgi:RNA polymerase sigma-70 factor (ECF subfamily)
VQDGAEPRQRALGDAAIAARFERAQGVWTEAEADDLIGRGEGFSAILVIGAEKGAEVVQELIDHAARGIAVIIVIIVLVPIVIVVPVVGIVVPVFPGLVFLIVVIVARAVITIVTAILAVVAAASTVAIVAAIVAVVPATAVVAIISVIAVVPIVSVIAIIPVVAIIPVIAGIIVIGPCHRQLVGPRRIQRRDDHGGGEEQAEKAVHGGSPGCRPRPDRKRSGDAPAVRWIFGIKRAARRFHSRQARNGIVETLKQELAGLTPRIRRFAWALTGSREEGDDLAQAALVKALGALRQFTPGTRLDAWTFRIVRTVWIDRGRAQSRRPTVHDPEAVEALSDDGVAARGAEARLDLARVRHAMSALPEDQRTVLALVAIEGLSYREAAEATGVPVGTVMSRLSRARARLAETLKEAA